MADEPTCTTRLNKSPPGKKDSHKIKRMKFIIVATSLLAFASSAAALKGAQNEDQKQRHLKKTFKQSSLKRANKNKNKGVGINDMASGLDIFTALLSPAVEVPFCMAANPALGNAIVTYDSFTNQLCANLTYSGLTGPELFSHIHGPAPIGTTADVLFTLSSGQIKMDCFTLTRIQQAYLESGLLYFNVHTDLCQPGEIRGQILPAFRY